MKISSINPESIIKTVARKTTRIGVAIIAWLWLRCHKLPEELSAPVGQAQGLGRELSNRDYYTLRDDYYPKYLRYLETGKLYKDKKVVFEISKPHRDKTVLEIGFGKGELLCALTEDGAACWGIDRSAAALELCNETLNRRGLSNEKRPKLLLGSALATDLYGEMKFDIVILCETLEHFLPAEIDRLTEILVRHIKPAGFLIIGSTQNPSTYHPPGHRTYGQHCTRIGDKFFKILARRLEGFFTPIYHGGGYTKFARTHAEGDFCPKVSIETHYGTGEYSDLKLYGKIIYFTEKYQRLYNLVVRKPRKSSRK